MAFVDVRGLHIHYERWGPETAPATVVLVHGLGSSAHIWDLVAPRLADRGMSVIALDQRGHGESDQPDTGYDFGSTVADLAAFADALGLTRNAIFVGHSWGASVVMQFAAEHADRTAGIVMVDGGLGSPGERWSWEETETRLRPPDIDGLLWADLHNRMSRSNGAYSDPRTEAVGRSLFHVDADGRVTRRFRIPNHMQVVRAMWESRPADVLARVQCPVLILPARQSSEPELSAAKIENVRRALELQPKARVRWFEDTVHDVPLQRPEEVADELIGFVDQTMETSVRT